MQAGPSCPLLLGTLDSPDYWTDEALVAIAQPATESQWRAWARWESQRVGRLKTNTS